MAANVALKSGVMSYLVSALFIVSLALKSEAMSYYRSRPSQCVAIQEPLCSGKYNYTIMPNILGHDTQTEASIRFLEFRPLIERNCSKHLKFFLCSLHFPMCTPQIQVGIPACRDMCEHVRAKCEPFMRVFDLPWPETLDCTKLPDHTEKNCLHPGNGERENVETEREVVNDDVIIDDVTNDDDVIGDQSRGHRRQSNRRRRKDRKGNRQGQRERVPDVGERIPDVEEDNDEFTEVPIELDLTVKPMEEPMNDEDWLESLPSEDGDLPEKIWIPPGVGDVPIFSDVESDTEDYPDADFDYSVESAIDYNEQSRFLPSDEDPESQPRCRNPEKFFYVKKLDKCLPVCDVDIDVMFSSSDKRFAYFWMLACSVLCIVSSALTVGTFLVDSKRFRYPERPIIFLSLCYLLYSSAYLVRLGGGPSANISCVTNDGSDVSHIVMGDLKSTGCTAVFFLLYYFGMAAAVWWVILSITWFLAAGLKWGHEAIEAHGFYFHLVAWLLPAVQTIVVLVMGKVDGDELTGLCYVGNLEPESLLYFVIVPLTSYLATGGLALGCGFGSLLKIRRVILSKSGEKDAGKLEKLMLKIGVFTVLYIVPTACVVAVHVYQYKNHASWVSRAEASPCTSPGLNTFPYRQYVRFNRNAPEHQPNSDLYEFQDNYYESDYYTDSIKYAKFLFDTRMRAYSQYGPSIQGTFGQFGPQSGDYDQRYRIKPEGENYDYKTGSFRQDSVFDTVADRSGKGDLYRGQNPESYDAGAFYTGRKLYRVPPYLNPEYDGAPGYFRTNLRGRPLQYNPKMARALQAVGTSMSPSDDKTPVPTAYTEAVRDCHLADSIPAFPIFVIKILMSLLAGITSGIWVWSGKTYKSWRSFCGSCWCTTEEKEKGTVETSNPPNAGSSGNVNKPQSVTSQTIMKNREIAHGPLSTASDNRYSYPIPSQTERYQGYQAVTNDEYQNEQTNSRMSYTSSGERRHPGSLTLGDIAREYSNHTDEDEIDENETFLRSNGHAVRNKYIVTSQNGIDSTSTRTAKKARENGGYAKNDKKRSKDKKSGRRKKMEKRSEGSGRSLVPSDQLPYNLHGDLPSTRWLRSQSNRAIPNSYEVAPTNRKREPSRDPKNRIRKFESHEQSNIASKKAKNSNGRIRKYSENDLKQLSLVSQTGFSPVSTSTRRKAESVNMSVITSL